jgi:2-keto-4-pentenoate hydratase/2-oxohepta-3-ene-1,7-dioic acid hydratase in catechol pathway
MRFMNHDGRMTLIDGDGPGIDVAEASAGQLPSSPADALDRWPELYEWARNFRGDGDIEIVEAKIGPPSPAPRQILGVGLNYASHASEAGLAVPEHPMIFPKLRATVTGPFAAIPISTETVDWEVELVLVIGREARGVAARDAWDYIAGLTIGQDLSDRNIQLRPPEVPQYSLGKSLPGFGPTGPVLVTADEFDNPEDLELRCVVNGEEVQYGRTADFIFTIPQIIQYISKVTILYSGDLIMTGTPAGIGATRTPPRFLAAGAVLESHITGIGTMRHEFVEGAENGSALQKGAVTAT